MATLSTLRQLGEQHQWNELKNQALSLWQQDELPDCLPLISLAQAHLGYAAEAERWLQQAQDRLDELSPSALTDLGGVLMVLMRFEQAELHLKQALSQDGCLDLAIARLGFCAMIRDDAATAQLLYEKSMRMQPERLTVQANLASLYLLQKQFALAQKTLEEAFEQLESLRENIPELLIKQYQAHLDNIRLQFWAETEAFAEAEYWLETLQSEQGTWNATPESKSVADTGSEAADNTEQQERFLALCLRYATVLAESEHHAQASEFLARQLKELPDNTELILRQADLAQVQGHFMQAINLIRRAIKLDKANPALWVQLSDVCLHRRDQQARSAAEKAVELAERLEESDDYSAEKIALLKLQSKNMLAQVECQEENFDLSEQLFTEVLEEQPWYLPALQGLGQQSMQQGNIERAVELFEKVKQLDPIKGYSSLINARQFPEDEQTLHRMEQAATRPGMEGKMRSGILFQLASAWEKRKEYDKAFELVQKANESSRKFLPYKAKAHRNECARIRMAFCKALYEYRPQYGSDSSLPVYVLGMPRSGTTLVEQILSGHSEIFGAGELGVIPRLPRGWNAGSAIPDQVVITRIVLMI